MCLDQGSIARKGWSWFGTWPSASLSRLPCCIPCILEYWYLAGCQGGHALWLVEKSIWTGCQESLSPRPAADKLSHISLGTSLASQFPHCCPQLPFRCFARQSIISFPDRKKKWWVQLSVLPSKRVIPGSRGQDWVGCGMFSSWLGWQWLDRLWVSWVHSQGSWMLSGYLVEHPLYPPYSLGPA